MLANHKRQRYNAELMMVALIKNAAGVGEIFGTQLPQHRRGKWNRRHAEFRCATRHRQIRRLPKIDELVVRVNVAIGRIVWHDIDVSAIVNLSFGHSRSRAILLTD